MRILVCKVMTPAFAEKVKTHLNSFTERDLRILSYHLLLDRWLKREIGESLLKYLPSDLLEPETVEQEVEDVTEGYQSSTRILWNGEVEKVDDIFEIISYKRKLVAETSISDLKAIEELTEEEQAREYAADQAQTFCDNQG